MDVMRIFSCLVLITGLAGCSTTIENYRWYDGRFVADKEQRVFKRVPGDNTLFEACELSRWSFPPQAFGGYSLFIEGMQGVFLPGVTLDVPSNLVKVAYYSDYHHLGRVETDASGRISVLKGTAEKILLDIKLTLNRGKYEKRIRLREWFVKTELDSALQRPLR